MKKPIYLLVILILCQSLALAEVKRELVLAIDRSGIEVVISKISPTKKNKFEEYVVKLEANKALADLSNTNAFILENPNRFVLDIPGKNPFKEESIFLADNYMALLRFGTHADKKRLVIDIEDSNVFNLNKNVNSKNSISYKLVLSTGNITPLKSELAKDSEVYNLEDSNIVIDIPSAKELESYLSPQSERYVQEIVAKRNLAPVKDKASNDTMLKRVEQSVVKELKDIEHEKNSSYLVYYLLLTCLIATVLFHRTKTKRQKQSYFRSLKELRAYSFNSVIKNQKRISNFKNAKIDSLGQTGVNPNRKNLNNKKPRQTTKNTNGSSYTQ